MKITIDDIDINYIEEGVDSYYTILFLEGWGTDIETYRLLINSLKQNFKIYALDFPGFGKTANPPKTYTVTDYAKITIKFINELKLKNVVLIGHSFGGRVIIKMVGELGFNPEKIVLIDSAGVKPKKSIKTKIKQKIMKLGRGVIKRVYSTDRAKEIIENYRIKNGSEDYIVLDETMQEVFKNIVNEDLTPFFANITPPTLLIWGEKDVDTPLSDAKLMEEKMKDAGLVVINNATHFSFLYDLNKVVLVINNFLERK